MPNFSAVEYDVFSNHSLNSSLGQLGGLWAVLGGHQLSELLATLSWSVGSFRWPPISQAVSYPLLPRATTGRLEKIHSFYLTHQKIGFNTVNVCTCCY